MAKLKANPEVYPYTPFHDLSNKNLKAKFVAGKKVSLADIKSLLNQLPKKQIPIKGNSIEENILNIFLDKNILFGPKSNVLSEKEIWHQKLNYFTGKNIPLQFSILGFPFKMPIPLKTNRITPDMGEILMLNKLFETAKLINSIYKNGVHVTIFAEGVFGRYNNQDKKEYKKYYITLKKFIKDLGYSNFLQIRELEEMENTVNNFGELFTKKVNLFTKQLRNSDPILMEKFNNVSEAIERIVKSNDFNISESEMMDLYNVNLTDQDIPSTLKKYRSLIRKRVKLLALNYFAYLKVRDDIDFLEKQIPHVLQMSVSPKKGRLGVLPIDDKNIRLAYHGVPVYSKLNNLFNIEYLIDLKRKNAIFQPVYLSGYPESEKPFYYVELK